MKTHKTGITSQEAEEILGISATMTDMARLRSLRLVILLRNLTKLSLKNSRRSVCEGAMFVNGWSTLIFRRVSRAPL